ncbi:MAG TPA: type II toxin-antitoxin system VapC family toxin [Thermoanaerobaculia bacterium]|nr:type II toxin-antitoxin system VapC family toxin [Thermoanaerobaculia bacterium]
MAAEPVFVFDACALIALLEDEPGAEVVEEILQDPTNSCLINAVSACEVYYDLCRRGNTEDADTLEKLFAEYGLELLDALPSDLWKVAGKLKAEWRRVSLADCFALALAIREEGILVTSDHHELDAIAKAGACPIRFIR